MMSETPSSFSLLADLAKNALLEAQFLPNFTNKALQEVEEINTPAQPDFPETKDLRDYLWFSLDNDDSRDLDQLTFAEQLESGFKIYVAIADVDSLVKKNSAIDLCAQNNTTSIYTPTKIFPMLPEKLSTHLTSLNEQQDRLAMIIEVEVLNDGTLGKHFHYMGYVRNQAKLAYNSVSAWLDGIGSIPALLSNNTLLDQQVRLQDHIAQILRKQRQKQGALTLQTIDPQAILKNQEIVDMVAVVKNRGRDLIEDFMIAANRAIANFMYENRLPSLRRVVRTPRRWDRIVAIAQKLGEKLSSEPDAKALDIFLKRQQALDPIHFPDLSLTIIKLLGNGEYVVEIPGEIPIGHFSLAVRDYTHSTAPNRRYPDLITQRLVKAVLKKQHVPYTTRELEALAEHCTQKEDDANKIERKMKKSAACLLLSSKINQTFDALVTGVTDKGTWVRIFHPPVEGKLIQGFENLDIGDQLRVKLIHTDVEKGFIDFIRS